MVPADSDRIPRVPPYSGYPMEFTVFRLQDSHLLWFSFPPNSTILWISHSVYKVLQPRSSRFGLFPFRSPLLRESIFLSFPPVTKMFQFTGLLSYTYVFSIRYLRITVGEFPHSDISGSKLTYSSPKHFVVCHVLHQLLVPRHPPYALTNLITICFLIWLRYFNVICRDILSNISVGALLDISLPHYPVFKELFFLRDKSLKTKQKFASIHKAFINLSP